MQIANKIIMIVLLVVLGLSIKWPLQLVSAVLRMVINITNGIVRVIEDEVLKLGQISPKEIEK